MNADGRSYRQISPSLSSVGSDVLQSTSSTSVRLSAVSRSRSSCRHPCEIVHLLPTRVATILLAMAQGGMMDYYLVWHNNRYWYMWIIADIAVFSVFVVAFVISYKQMQQPILANLLAFGGVNGVRKGISTGYAERVKGTTYSKTLDDQELEGPFVRGGGVPLSYFAWLVYSSFLAIRMFLVYKNFAQELTENNFLGSNLLQVTVASSAVVFLLLLYAHHDAAPESRRHHRIDGFTYTVIFDIVDAVDLLGVFFLGAKMEPWVEWFLLLLACANLLLPTLPLMILSKIRYGIRRTPEYLHTCQKLLVLLGINVPLLAARLLIWHYLKLPISTFIVKNIAVSFVVLYSFYEHDHHRRLQAEIPESQEMVS